MKTKGTYLNPCHSPRPTFFGFDGIRRNKKRGSIPRWCFVTVLIWWRSRCLPVALFEFLLFDKADDEFCHVLAFSHTGTAKAVFDHPHFLSSISQGLMKIASTTEATDEASVTKKNQQPRNQQANLNKRKQTGNLIPAN